MTLIRPLRLSLWCIALVFFGWALAGAQFRDAEGLLGGRFCLPISVGIAFSALAWAAGTHWVRPTFWFAVAIVGQAIALQLIDAGPQLHYQHYLPAAELLSFPDGWFLILLWVQTALVMFGLRRHAAAIGAWLARAFRPWQLILLGLSFIAPVAAASRDIPGYISEVLFAVFVQAINLGALVLLAWSVPDSLVKAFTVRFESVFGSNANIGHSDTASVDRFAVAAAVWVTVLAAVLSVVTYENHPHITDEVAYLYHARILANGSLTLPAPPVADGFGFYLMDFRGDQWFATTPPGWPAMLALGVRLGVPWLVNPILAGLNILLVYALLTSVYDQPLARLAVFMLCLSPWYVFMAMNFMTHMFTLTCALIAAVAVSQARKQGHIGWGALAGAAVGMSTLIRPLDGLIIGVVIGLWVIGIGGRRLRIPAIVAFGLGAAIVSAAVLPYNAALTGGPLTFPLNAYLDRTYGPGRNDLGFGPNRGFDWALQPFPGHSPLGAIVNAELNTFSINIELFGWSMGSLLFVALALVGQKLRGSDYLMLAVCAAIFTAYFFYYYSGGPDFGARYWFLMIVPCAALSVRGIRLLQEKLTPQLTGSPAAQGRVLIAVLSLCIMAGLNYFPWRALDKYHNFWGMRPDMVSLAQQYAFGRSLVLIEGTDSHPDYTSAAIYNPLSYDANVPVYAWDRGPEVRAALMKAFPDRPVWIVEGPSLTHAGYRVAEGPIRPRVQASQ